MTIDRRAFSVLAAMAAASVVAAACASSARTAPNEPIDDGLFVKLNGVDQWVTIEGADQRNPVILFVHGGPGFPTSWLKPLFSSWEQDFTVVQWDQPGAGATFTRNGGEPGIGVLTANRVAADAITLTEYLRTRLGVRKVVLMGHSWGTTVGLTAIRQRPDLFSAYVGTGQVVDVRRSDALGYDIALNAARAANDQAAIAELEKVGPPPYATVDQRNIKQKYVGALVAAERIRQAEVGKVMATPPPPTARWSWPRDVLPYDGAAAMLASGRLSFLDNQAFQARSLGPKFDVPMLFFQGEKDAVTVTSLVVDYFAEIQAPAKRLVLIPEAGHQTVPYFTVELAALLKTHVRPKALGKDN